LGLCILSKKEVHKLRALAGVVLGLTYGFASFQKRKYIRLAAFWRGPGAHLRLCVLSKEEVHKVGLFWRDPGAQLNVPLPFPEY